MRLTIRDFKKLKLDGERVTMLTAYDATSARLAEAAGVNAILVGDTLGMVVQGHDSTIPVTLEHMIYHAEIVSRVTKSPLIIGDMPFMTYNVSAQQALANAARLMQEGRVSCIKLEGGAHIAPTIKQIVQSGIPVMAHIGLTPQSVNQLGGFRVQGKALHSALQLIHDADVVQEAGAFAVVLELVPAPLAQIITDRLEIPTIGIGAGAGCDGQVQVFHDILALFDSFVPRHTKQYSNVGSVIREAVQHYIAEVKDGTFPTAEHSFEMSAEVLEAVRERLLESSADASR